MLKYLKRAVASIRLTATILLISISSSGIHNKYLRYEVGESVVQVLSPIAFGGGTGFAVQGASGKNYIMTNHHVCEVAVNGRVLIKRDGDKAIKKRVLYKDNRHDLCLIEGDAKFAPLSISKYAPEKGDLHYVVGHPGLRQLTVSQGEYIGFDNVQLVQNVSERSKCYGKIIELDPIQQFFAQKEWVCVRDFKSYATSAVIYGGNSGSPVVDKWGNLIAVAFAGSVQQERDNYLVPLHEIKRVLSHF